VEHVLQILLKPWNVLQISLKPWNTSYKKCKNRGTACKGPRVTKGDTFNLDITPFLTVGPPQKS
jgi:hypothetical protein